MTNSWFLVCPLMICLILGIKEASSMALSSELFGDPNDVDIKDFPWQAAIINSRDDIFTCGGAIISSRHILTSTICLLLGDSDVLHAFVGSSIIGKGTEYAIKSNYSYTNGNATWPYAHDIAIIELDGEIAFDETKRAIELPNEDVALPPGAILILTGWGIVMEGPRPSDQLKKQNLRVTENWICDKILQDFVGDDDLPPMEPRQVCGLPVEGTTQCQGNMGTPVIYNGNLFGVAVESNPCGPGGPEFIDRVYDHVDWIRRTIGSAH